MSATITTTARKNQVPLCVDLDGTLIKTDMLWESFVRLIRRNPLWLFVVPYWWVQGRAFLKRQIAARVQVDVAALPYNGLFLEFLCDAKRQGRRLILATASDREMADRVAKHVGLFDEVLASDGKTNLRGAAKREALTTRFGERGFDYAGNSAVDLAVWAGTREAIVVNAGRSLTKRAARITKVGNYFPRKTSPSGALFKALRPHQWVKNLIVFVPIITSHQISFWPLLAGSAAFMALCLCASGGYVLNDLMDLDADRHHPVNRRRPFAAGNLPLPLGLLLVPLLLAASAVVAWQIAKPLVALLGLYLVMTTVYSSHLKRVPLLDVFVLAGLYTLRLIAGHVVTGIAYSSWLLVFSMFIFLSLALMKRFRELQALREQNEMDAKGRGYTVDDLELVATLGLVSGSLAVLVLALYVNSPQVVELYQHPLLLLLICPLMLYWISRVWLLAHRGQMHTDPVVFALKDWPSYVIGALTLAVMWFATGR
jgi:4-hydroxybenzoate polyprenyltransferase/phosphoserine phosphatase